MPCQRWRTWQHIGPALNAGAVLLSLLAVEVVAQPLPAAKSKRKAVRVLPKAEAVVALQSHRPVAAPLPAGAVVNTNEELERLLDRADQLVASGRSELAPVLWQRVLDEAGDVLASQSDGKTETRLHVYQSYRPLREETIRRMIACGPEALRAYRLHSDGAARSLWNGSQTAPAADRDTALTDIVQRYLLTAVGPAAAFEQACRQLEQGEDLAAVRLLSAVESCPDHGIPSAAVTVRMSVALHRLGAVEAALELLARDNTVPTEHRRLIENEFSRRPTAARSPSRIPADSPVDLLAESTTALAGRWEQSLSYTLKAAPPPPTGSNRAVIAEIDGRRVVLRVGANGRMVQPQANSDAGRDLKPEELANLWTEAKWQPVGRVQLAGDRVLVKSQERLLCLSADTGRPLWMGRRNKYPHAPESLQAWMWQLMGAAPDANSPVRLPRTLTEITLFGDQIPQLFAVSDDLVLNVEGELAHLSSPTPANDNNGPRAAFEPFGGLPVEQQSRQNWLAAYDLQTGKLRWHRSPLDGDETGQAWFVSSPLAVGGALVTAVSDGQRLSLLAMDRARGQTLWRTTLCDVPPPGVSPWSAVGIAADQEDLFVSTGAGAVCFLNGLDGSVRQVVAYPRKLSADLRNSIVEAANTPTGSQPFRSTSRDNLVLPVDDQLIVLAADFDHIFSLDRRTGGLRWEAPLTPRVRDQAGVACLGLADRMLIVAGYGAVRGYSVIGGRVAWDTTIPGSFGRCAVTTDAVFVPLENKILQLDPQTGATLGSGVLLSGGRGPIGNLSTDGRRLVILGAANVSTWERAPPQPAEDQK
uniref:Pyrrolo-quinoline quinone repeat domain-containing protein n=1 Tax=Schlesneria paludicola TaxID=360056 RepID=A0A7C2JWC2_9PLAN